MEVTGIEVDWIVLNPGRGTGRMESWWIVLTRHPLKTVSGQDTPTGPRVLHLVVMVSSPGQGRCWRGLTMVARSVKEMRRSSGDVSRSRVNCQDLVRTPSCVSGPVGASGEVAPPPAVLELSPGSESSWLVRGGGREDLWTRTNVMEVPRRPDLVRSSLVPGKHPHQVIDS